MSRTVRDVLTEWLGDDPDRIGAMLRDLADVLSTGDGWVTRPIAAHLLEAGDVVVSKDGLLLAVTAIATADDGRVSPELVRGDDVKTPSIHPRKKVPTLLTRTDQRALDLLADQLGAELVAREVA